MSSDLSTIDLQTGSPGTDVSASGAWSESFVNRPETLWAMPLLELGTGLLFAITASPATAVPDYWFFERRWRSASTATGILEEAIGRPISRSEALKICDQIMEQAERARLEFTEWEAKRGIQWEAGE